MYLLALAAEEFFKGHSHRLSRVTAAVSYCYNLVAQTGRLMGRKSNQALEGLLSSRGGMARGASKQSILVMSALERGVSQTHWKLRLSWTST